MTKINICLCTFKRPKLLTICLESLRDIIVPPNITVTVTVIDNDKNHSAETIVDKFREAFPFNIYYYCETKRGIPCARNCAIHATLSLKSDYLVFIDDDEWVESLWLNHLYAYCKEQGGEIIVSGNVISELPDKTPEHIRCLFNKKQRDTGSQLDSCATNNVLIPIHVVGTLGLRFDETNPFSGGEDTRFFYEAAKAGVVIKKCAEALVHETVPVSRTTLTWLSKRKFAVGTTVAWRKMQGGRTRLSIVLSSVSVMIFALLNSFFMILIGNKLSRNKSWLKVCRSFGVLSGVFGVSVDSYRKVDGG